MSRLALKWPECQRLRNEAGGIRQSSFGSATRFLHEFTNAVEPQTNPRPWPAIRAPWYGAQSKLPMPSAPRLRLPAHSSQGHRCRRRRRWSGSRERRVKRAWAIWDSYSTTFAAAASRFDHGCAPRPHTTHTDAPPAILLSARRANAARNMRPQPGDDISNTAQAVRSRASAERRAGRHNLAVHAQRATRTLDMFPGQSPNRLFPRRQYSLARNGQSASHFL